MVQEAFDFPEYSDKSFNRGGSFKQLRANSTFMVEVVHQESRKGDKVGTRYDGQWQVVLTVRPLGLDGKVTGPRAFVNLDLPLLRKYKDESGTIKIEEPTQEIADKFRFAMRDVLDGTLPVFPPAKLEDGSGYQDMNLKGELYGPVYTKEQVWGKDGIAKKREKMLKQLAQRLATNTTSTHPQTGEVVEPISLVGYKFIINTSKPSDKTGRIYNNIGGAPSNPRGLIISYDNFEQPGSTDSDMPSF